jgi:hypothetical protein
LLCTPAGEKRINRPESPASGARGLLLPYRSVRTRK